MSFPGYLINGEQDNFHYVSLSRLHPRRIQDARRLSERQPGGGDSLPPPPADPCSGGEDGAGAPADRGTPGKGPEGAADVEKAETDSEVRQTTKMS